MFFDLGYGVWNMELPSVGRSARFARSHTWEFLTPSFFGKSILLQADLEGGWYEFEKDYFGSVFFEGKTIPCISLKGQKVFHSGYELRDKDKHDISILESLSK